MQPLDDLRISRFIDGDFDNQERLKIEAEIAASADLQQLVKDLRLLKQLAAAPAPDPPPYLRTRIQAELASVYVRSKRRWFWALLPMAVALLLWGVLTPRHPNEAFQSARMDIAAAAQNYQQAVEKMESLSREKLHELPEDVALVFEANLAIVDQSIAEAERLVGLYPDEHVVYASLMHIYQVKVTLLERILAS